MLVCSCHHVSDRVIRAVIADGAVDEEQVGESCLAGTGGGGCLEYVCQLLGEAGVPGHGLCATALAS